jgi:hypothetical protein
VPARRQGYFVPHPIFLPLPDGTFAGDHATNPWAQGDKSNKPTVAKRHWKSSQETKKWTVSIAKKFKIVNSLCHFNLKFSALLCALCFFAIFARSEPLRDCGRRLMGIGC